MRPLMFNGMEFPGWCGSALDEHHLAALGDLVGTAGGFGSEDATVILRREVWLTLIGNGLVYGMFGRLYATDEGKRALARSSLAGLSDSRSGPARLSEYEKAAHALGGLTFEARLDRVLDELRTMLLEKNLAYGNSALDPVRIFSEADPVEQLRVRLDDKLSRLVSAAKRRRAGEHVAELEDVPGDIMGYVVLLKIAEQIGRENRAGS